jgi:hypothetical protein
LGDAPIAARRAYRPPMLRKANLMVEVAIRTTHHHGNAKLADKE